MSELKNPLILTELKDRVLTIRMNRPDKKNALTQAMYTAMADTLIEAEANADVRVVLFTGTLDAFTSGNDLKDFMNVPPATSDSPVARFMNALAAFPKPVVAAVNGPAIGIGATMLMHCDLVYAGVGARLQFPFVNIGICPEFASTFLMPRIMGHVRAAELLLFGEPFTSAIAKECGMVNEVLPDADVEPRALERATRLAQQAPNALRVSKMLMKRWSEKEVIEAIVLEADYFVPMLRKPEAIEAITAFMTKRKPDFSKFE